MFVMFGLLLTSVACAQAEEEEALPPDAEDSAFVNTNAKDDSQGVQEGSWEGFCVLNLANSASAELLKEVVHSWPAKQIFETRIGRDKIAGTADDRPFETLKELDAVRYVGFITFSQLKRYAAANGFCPAIGEETLVAGEQRLAEQVAERSAQLVIEKFESEGFARRDAHPKSHGCVKAHIDIDNRALSPEERIGLFASNQSYPAWIRFSNGSPLIQVDNQRDVRGMAIKVMEVEGDKVLERHRDEQTQDFLLINGSAFFVKTPADYLQFTKKALDGSPVSFFLSLDPREWRLRELYNLLSIVGKKPSSPITQYWSTTPYALGEGRAVKYSARPCGEFASGWPKNPGADFLHDSLADALRSDDACFNFMVQRQVHAGGTPIEDSTVNWDDTDSPFLKVATIRIPSQSFDSPEHEAFCEDLSFNPWHTLPEHRPLGNINRTRRVVYDLISDLRHTLNDSPPSEPRSHAF